jgi:hypothetical protein
LNRNPTLKYGVVGLQVCVNLNVLMAAPLAARTQVWSDLRRQSSRNMFGVVDVMALLQAAYQFLLLFGEVVPALRQLFHRKLNWQCCV